MTMPDTLNPHGYSLKGHYRVSYPGAENPARQGCNWNAKEEADLKDALQRGDAIETISAHHQRTQSAIDHHMQWVKLL
jgi:hypothetical protein